MSQRYKELGATTMLLAANRGLCCWPRMPGTFPFRTNPWFPQESPPPPSQLWAGQEAGTEVFEERKGCWQALGTSLCHISAESQPRRTAGWNQGQIHASTELNLVAEPCCELRLHRRHPARPAPRVLLPLLPTASVLGFHRWRPTSTLCLSGQDWAISALLIWEAEWKLLTFKSSAHWPRTRSPPAPLPLGTAALWKHRWTSLFMVL